MNNEARLRFDNNDPNLLLLQEQIGECHKKHNCVLFEWNGKLRLKNCFRNDMKCVEFWDKKVCDTNQKKQPGFTLKITDLRYKHLEKQLESIIKGG